MGERILKIDHTGTFEEQMEQCRQALLDDPRYMMTKDFGDWCMEHRAELFAIKKEDKAQ